MYIYVYIYIYILDISSGRKDHFISKFIGGSITTCFVLVHSSDAGGGMMLWIFLKFVDFFQGWLEDFQSLSLKKFLFHITVPHLMADNRYLFLCRHLFINSLLLFSTFLSVEKRMIVFSRLQRLHLPIFG